MKTEGTPLSKFSDQYRKKREAEQQREIVERDQRLLKSEDLPEVERPDWRDREPRKASAQERAEFKNLFELGSSDEDDSDGDDPPKKRQKVEKSDDSDEYR